MKTVRPTSNEAACARLTHAQFWLPIQSRAFREELQNSFGTCSGSLDCGPVTNLRQVHHLACVETFGVGGRNVRVIVTPNDESRYRRRQRKQLVLPSLEIRRISRAVKPQDLPLHAARYECPSPVDVFLRHPPAGAS